jgi:hypothetical protein
MDWMYAACSTTARRGAIDWSSRFKDNLKPLFNELYDSVRDGTETQRSLDYNSQKDYRAKYEKEMEEIRNLEIWRAGKAVRYVIFPPFITTSSMTRLANICSSFQLAPSREPEINNILIPRRDLDKSYDVL